MFSQKKQRQNCHQQLLRELLETQQRYENANILIPESIFQEIRSGINSALAFLRPGGSNGNLSSMNTLIQQVFNRFGVRAEDYWTQTWRKSGRKDLAQYNNPLRSATFGKRVVEIPEVPEKLAA